MQPDLGPVIFAIGSHRDGIHPVRESVTNRPGAYAWAIEREAEIIAKYPQAAPLTEPGDIVILDFLVMHCSGFNRSTQPRWSMQMRLFNYLEPSGVELGWKGSVADGVKVRDLLPQFVLPAPAGAS
jgi:ectoine hydroxylase-related dioxygenase (phytanoyl-CoA dioxygenase family)